MTYRVTNSMMQSLLLNDMHTNLSKLLDVQQQMSTQRKYQSASDNPNAVTKGMGLIFRTPSRGSSLPTTRLEI